MYSTKSRSKNLFCYFAKSMNERALGRRKAQKRSIVYQQTWSSPD